MRLSTARDTRPELVPRSEPLDVAAYRARKQEALEAGEE